MRGLPSPVEYFTLAWHKTPADEAGTVYRILEYSFSKSPVAEDEPACWETREEDQMLHDKRGVLDWE
jgi:hypothetical protein